MKTKFLLLLLALLPALASASTGKSILIVGDSLSAAFGLPVEQGWVTLLQKRLGDARLPYRLVNASISGDTTAGALARLPRAIALHQPHIVVLELGGNDGLRGLSLAAMKQNLAAMIEMSRQHGAQVLLIGVELPPNYGPLYTEKFHAVYHQLAGEYRVALLPSMVSDVGTRSELMQDDGIHPNLDAQPLIAERVWQHLRPLLEAPAAADQQSPQTRLTSPAGQGRRQQQHAEQ
jgi:acyl-CoA thioesterase-1